MGDVKIKQWKFVSWSTVCKIWPWKNHGEGVGGMRKEVLVQLCKQVQPLVSSLQQSSSSERLFRGKMTCKLTWDLLDVSICCSERWPVGFLPEAGVKFSQLGWRWSLAPWWDVTAPRRLWNGGKDSFLITCWGVWGQTGYSCKGELLGDTSAYQTSGVSASDSWEDL